MEWFDETDFETLENVVQSYGFIFDDNGHVCVVNCEGKRWSLPGGHPEDYDDNFEDTLIREVDEEADLDIKNIKRIGYFKVIPLTENCELETHHALRYITEVEKIKDQTIDPAVNLIPKREFVHPDKFNEFVNWGENGVYQLKKALDSFRK